MKILFTGGGTGGHFYPIIAVADELHRRCADKKLLPPKLYFFSDQPYNSQALIDQRITFVRIPAGKVRRYFSWLNFSDAFKTGWGIILSLIKVFWLYPDVIFSKGGYASFPTVLAGRLLAIPIFIHESDSHPGRVNLWAGRFAKRIAISYPEVASYFSAEKTALTGNPVRRELQEPLRSGAHEFLQLDPEVPSILVLGGSLGAAHVNDVILEALPELLSRFQLIHQVGRANYQEVQGRAKVILADSPWAQRYQVFDYLNETAMSMAAGAAKLVISRAGSTIFEIALWGLPAIIVPISQRVSHDQENNAFSYAKTGAAVVIKDDNLSPSILVSEVKRILADDQLCLAMSQAAKNFARRDSAEIIAEELINLALAHDYIK